MKTLDYNRPSLEILGELAKESGRKFEFFEKAYPHTVFAKSFPYKRTFYIPNNADEICYYAGHSDGKSISEYAIYCGVFIPINLPISSKLKIREKNILDKLNPFFKSNSFTTGNRMFDNQLVINGDVEIETQRFLKSRQVQSLIFGAFELKEPIYIGINELDVDFVPALKSKSCFSIFVTGKWILEDSIIEKLFQLVEKFQNTSLIV